MLPLASFPTRSILTSSGAAGAEHSTRLRSRLESERQTALFRETPLEPSEEG